MEDTNVPDGNTLADKVEINLDMLGALMLDGVGGEVGGADVVAIDQSGLRQGVVQLHKQLMKPTHRWPRRWWRKRPSDRYSTETLRKWWRGSRSFIANCCWRAVVVRWRTSGLEAVRTMSST
jgi:hypothetical protein